MMGLLSMFLTLYVFNRCFKCEAVDNLSADSEQYGKRTHVVWQDPGKIKANKGLK